MQKKYEIREDMPDEIKGVFKVYSPLVSLLLYTRGISDLEEADKFLNPDYDKHTYDPYLLKDMKKVVDRIILAIEKNEKIAIYSDYDADGIPGAVALYDFFKKINFNNFINYIPLRNEEGFGLNHEAIDNLVSQGVSLLITIDCGVADGIEVETAKKHNLDIIITDHHLPRLIGRQSKQDLPNAFAIINPKQDSCNYPEKMLCGAGVIFKIIQALALDQRLNFPKGHEKWLLDMIGLATLSDMVPLLGENRIFAYYGMKVLKKSPRAGLMKLFSLLKIDQRYITEDDIAFMITPRINAASRMGLPMDAFNLLSTTDIVSAGVLAEHLNKKNDERKGLVASMVKEIKKRIHNREDEMKNVLVLGNPDWKPSLLGLVAGSFSDEHNRPVFLWGREGVNGDSIIKGSCRSGNGISVVSLMEKTKDVFLEYGGHHGAGGFSVSTENIHILENKLNEAFLEIQNDLKEIDILVDKKISLEDINWETYRDVEKFAPFGFENPKPLFLFENVEVSAVKQFGKEKNHLEIKIRENGKEVSAMAFFSNPEKFSVPVEVGRKINLVANLEKSNFRNFPELRLRIIDIF